MKNTVYLSLLLFLATTVSAQKVKWYSSVEGNTWNERSLKMERNTNNSAVLEVDANNAFLTFNAWGTAFNELGWDALNELTREEQAEILNNIWGKEGDLKFNMGRFSMNANDYARDWYSCDEVPGDFQLKYFNIDRDKTTLIPFIKAAQEINPDLWFWVSPWSPPSWMKINQYYSVVSNKDYNELNPKLDYLLYEGDESWDNSVFPGRVSANNYFIQEPRYLQTYANYFSKYISAYAEEGIDIDMVMFQNESWSYTPYPGCAWKADGIIRFNVEYLAPTLKKDHPDVEVILGTINTNRYEIIDEVLSDPRMKDAIDGVGFQWEGRQILPKIREKYPNYKYVQTESECGWGSFNWASGEHTFKLINNYLGNGCEEYTFWNVILTDDGTSTWGWKQNALIRVDSKANTATLTPEYFAVKHYTHFITPGSKLLSYTEEDNVPVLVAVNPADEYVVVAGNMNDTAKEVSVKIGDKYLNASIQPHSFNTFVTK